MEDLAYLCDVAGTLAQNVRDIGALDYVLREFFQLNSHNIVVTIEPVADISTSEPWITHLLHIKSLNGATIPNSEVPVLIEKFNNYNMIHYYMNKQTDILRDGITDAKTHYELLKMANGRTLRFIMLEQFHIMPEKIELVKLSFINDINEYAKRGEDAMIQFQMIKNDVAYNLVLEKMDIEPRGNILRGIVLKEKSAYMWADPEDRMINNIVSNIVNAPRIHELNEEISFVLENRTRNLANHLTRLSAVYEPSTLPGSSTVLASSAVPASSTATVPTSYPGLSSVLGPNTVPGSSALSGSSVFPAPSTVPASFTTPAPSAVPTSSVFPISSILNAEPSTPSSPITISSSSSSPSPELGKIYEATRHAFKKV